MRRTALVALTVLVGLNAVACATPRAISTRTLLAEMTDLPGLAEFPAPAYTCRQFSSYDRASVSPEDHEAWFANRDAGHYLRTIERAGRREYVMVDASGPGALVRIWSANPKGTLRVYLDHADTPVIEAKMTDLLGGKVAGFPPPLAGMRSRGWNLYFPIPYARHCLVTSDDDGFYYHVNYRTYPAGTEVVTFTADDLEGLADDVAAIAAHLASPAERSPALTPADAHQDANHTLPPGARISVPLSTAGPHAIVGLRVNVEADDVTEALRRLLLKIDADGKETVICPLGDFFGAAPGVNPYCSLPSGVAADGTMWCDWVMPYRESARVEILNAGRAAARLRLRVVTRTYEWDDASMYFCAQWRCQRNISTRPMQDWNYVDIEGQGVFAGAAFAITNPVKAWWGEGDEKIYVDGETFPSHFGTGTEDYFGYAWCWPAPFTHAYHSQPRCDGPGNYGHTAVNRWHILDRIPFRRSFRFDMELWHWWEGVVPEMSVVAYWYARPGATSNRVEIRPEDLHLVDLPPYVAPRVAGALEGEDLLIVQQAGTPGPQTIDGCSNDQHLWWHEAQPGDRLVLEFTHSRAGRYRLFARFVRARDYGMVQLSVNGAPLGAPLDFYHDRVAVSDEMSLGEIELHQGVNQFGVEILGANAQAIKGYMFGLDYLRLEPAP